MRSFNESSDVQSDSWCSPNLNAASTLSRLLFRKLLQLLKQACDIQGNATRTACKSSFRQFTSRDVCYYGVLQMLILLEQMTIAIDHATVRHPNFRTCRRLANGIAIFSNNAKLNWVLRTCYLPCRGLDLSCFERHLRHLSTLVCQHFHVHVIVRNLTQGQGEKARKTRRTCGLIG